MYWLSEVLPDDLGNVQLFSDQVTDFSKCLRYVVECREEPKLSFAEMLRVPSVSLWWPNKVQACHIYLQEYHDDTQQGIPVPQAILFCQGFHPW